MLVKKCLQRMCGITYRPMEENFCYLCGSRLQDVDLFYSSDTACEFVVCSKCDSRVLNGFYCTNCGCSLPQQ